MRYTGMSRSVAMMSPKMAGTRVGAQTPTDNLKISLKRPASTIALSKYRADAVVAASNNAKGVNFSSASNSAQRGGPQIETN